MKCSPCARKCSATPRANKRRFSVAAALRRLHRRTAHAAIATEHAAVAGLRLQARSAERAFEEEEARVGRHRLRAAAAASRTGDDALEDRHFTISTGTSERCMSLEQTEPMIACGAPTTRRSQPDLAACFAIVSAIGPTSTRAA